MRDDNPKPINYAGPEQQRPPRFYIAWGGWVLVAFLLIALMAQAGMFGAITW